MSRAIGPLRFVLFAALLTVIPGAAHAQSLPNRPVTFIYPYGAGSALEVSLRLVNAEAGKLLGQQIVQENRPGANARMGVLAFRQGRPDGSLISYAPDTLLVHQPLIDPNFRLEMEKDYVPVTFLLRNILVLIANPSVPFRDVKGLVAYAKTNPGKLNWAFTPGSITHFFPEMFRQTTAAAMTMVPYKGAGDQLIPMITGQVDIAVSSLGTVKSTLESGKLLALATLGGERAALLPSVPTLQESGVPIVQSTWFGLIAPAGTPPDVIVRLNRAYNAALKSPEIQKRFLDLAITTDPSMSPADFGAFIKSEIATWSPVLRTAGIKMQ